MRRSSACADSLDRSCRHLAPGYPEAAYTLLKAKIWVQNSAICGFSSWVWRQMSPRSCVARFGGPLSRTSRTWLVLDLSPTAGPRKSGRGLRRAWRTNGRSWLLRTPRLRGPSCSRAWRGGRLPGGGRDECRGGNPRDRGQAAEPGRWIWRLLTITSASRCVNRCGAAYACAGPAHARSSPKARAHQS